MQQKHYDAFISYRHKKAEKAAAIRIQRYLERHKKADGKKLRVFRDQSELPTSNNLGNDIRRALENSDYLIVLCGPTYSESKYCMEELTYFRQLHGNTNENILPVLVEGEPSESFPEQLLWKEEVVTREDGTRVTIRKDVEPLGADIRSDWSWVRNRKLRTEYLRLAAPILGKSFDGLYQREKRRQMTGIAAVVGIVAALAIGFSLYSTYMMNQIRESQQALLANDSLRLASESAAQMEEGDTNLAMLLALEALPKDFSDPERPLVAEAEAALRSSVLTRQWEENASALQHITKLEFDTSGWHIIGSYDNGRKIAINDWQEVSLYDAANGMELFRCPATFADAYFSEDCAYVLIFNGRDIGGTYRYEIALYDTQTGKLLNQQVVPCKDQQLPYFWWDNSRNLCYMLLRAGGQDPAQMPVENELYQIGKDGSLTACPADYIEEQNFDGDQSRDMPSDAETVYIAASGERSALGEKYWRYIERHWESRYTTAQITNDEELLIFYDREADASVVYSLDLLEAGIRKPMTVPGFCDADGKNHLLYTQTEHSLNIYAYNVSQRFTQMTMGEYILEEISLLSSDGSRCFSISYMIRDGQTGSIHGSDREGLWILDSNALSSPLLEVFHSSHDPYYVSAELEYIFLQTAEDTFQLWSVDEGCILTLTVDAGLGALAERLSVSADGSLLAIGYENGLVQVYSGNNGKMITQIDCTEKQRMKNHVSTIAYLEFEGSRLLITGNPSGQTADGWSWVVDVSGKEETVQIEDSILSEELVFTDRYLTSDGLLFCGGSYLPNTLDAIYDLRTRERIFENLSYYHYDENNGILLYLLAHPGFSGNPILYALRRTDSGAFEQIYSLKPQAGEVIFTQDPYCRNSAHVLLVSAQYVKVYEIETGEEQVTVYYTMDGEAEEYGSDRYLRFVEDTVFDLRFRADEELIRYPIASNEELTDAAREYLTSDLGTRQLTEMERSKFFIEENAE